MLSFWVQGIMASSEGAAGPLNEERLLELLAEFDGEGEGQVDEELHGELEGRH